MARYVTIILYVLLACAARTSDYACALHSLREQPHPAHFHCVYMCITEKVGVAWGRGLHNMGPGSGAFIVRFAHAYA